MMILNVTIYISLLETCPKNGELIMETAPSIIVCITLLFAIIGIVASIMYLFNQFTIKGKCNNTIIIPSDMKYVPTTTPYEYLWEQAKLSSYLDMDFVDFNRLKLPGEKGSNESIYYDALIKVLNRGKQDLSSLTVSSLKGDPELRKFCIERTTSISGNVYRDTVRMLRTTDMLYNYILSGKIPENKIEK